MNNISKTTIANYFLLLTTTLTSIVLNPILLLGLGPVYFAIWKSSQKLIEIASGFDGGAVQTLKWFTASDSSKSDNLKQTENFAYGLKLLKRWFPVSLFTVIGVSFFQMSSATSGKQEVDPIVLVAVLIAGIASTFGLYAQLYESLLLGLNMGYKSLTLRICALLTTNALMIVVCDLKNGLILVSLLFALNVGVISIGFIRMTRGYIRQKGVVRDIHAFEIFRTHGRRIWVWEFLQRVLISWELLILTIVGLPALINSYFFSTFIFQFGLALTLLSVSATTSSLASEIKLGRTESVLKKITALRSTTLSLASCIAVIIILLNESFVYFWAGESNYIGTFLNCYFAITFLQMALIRTDSQLIESSLKIAERTIVTASIISVGTIVSFVIYFTTGSVTGSLICLGILRLYLNFRMPRIVLDIFGNMNYPMLQLCFSSSIIMTAFAVNYFFSLGTSTKFVLAFLFSAVLLAPLGSIESRKQLRIMYTHGPHSD